MIQLKPTQEKQSVVNLTPLIDIVFQLLIFFMLTAFFITPEGIQIKLPNADQPEVELKKEIEILIDRQGRIYIKDIELSLEELERELKQAYYPGRPIVLKADRQVVLDVVVSVMDLAKGLGYEKLIIATESERAQQ